MAITQAMCTSFKVELLNGIHAFSTTVARGNTNADSFKLALYTSSASLGAGTTAYTTSGGYINFNQADFCVVGDYYDATGYVDIPAGASDVLWEFPGDAYGEISFEVYAPDGTLIGQYGANQPAGLLILCDTDLGS